MRSTLLRSETEFFKPQHKHMPKRTTHKPLTLAFSRVPRSLAEKGIHGADCVFAHPCHATHSPLPAAHRSRVACARTTEVTARRFCLVSADHPLVSAISENAEK